MRWLALAAAGFLVSALISDGAALAQGAGVSPYASRVVGHLARQKRYPSEAKRLALEGTAIVAFTVEPGGGVSNVELVKSSGSAILDYEVQSMVMRAHPFPRPPQGQPQRFIAPVNFQLEAGRSKRPRAVR